MTRMRRFVCVGLSTVTPHINQTHSVTLLWFIALRDGKKKSTLKVGIHPQQAICRFVLYKLRRRWWITCQRPFVCAFHVNDPTDYFFQITIRSLQVLITRPCQSRMSRLQFEEDEECVVEAINFQMVYMMKLSVMFKIKTRFNKGTVCNFCGQAAQYEKRIMGVIS